MFAGLIAVLAFIPFAVQAGQPIVKEIKLEGNKRTADESVFSVISTSVGAPLNLEFVDKDVKAIYGLGQSRDVEVDSESVPGGVEITFVLDEKPLIGEIAFHGNKKIKKDDLLAEVTQRTYSVLDDRAVAESMHTTSRVRRRATRSSSST